ncbi:MAG: 23S rRNA (guanosine(2251)-2'-O)-methyltransferase RlmB [Myxococcota bacterium]|nr:23S rRNA (guanosine(2251)-2'-O)-methyltransferase RlmB [Myxococcota bacterium]
MRPRPRERARAPSPRRRDAERDWLLGIHSVGEALRARRRVLHQLRLRRSAGAGPRPELGALLERARELRVPCEELPAERFDQAAPEGTPHQGVMLEVGPLPEVTLADLAAGGPDCWLLALDRVEDPQNLGALLRVADAAGVVGVVVPERHSAPLSPAVSRASAGALEHLPVARVTNLARALRSLKEREFWVYAADPSAGRDLFAAPDRLFEGRLVLLLGAEGRGLRRLVREQADECFGIPMGGAVASLNVATAAAVVLFDWRRRQRARAAPDAAPLGDKAVGPGLRKPAATPEFP